VKSGENVIRENRRSRNSSSHCSATVAPQLLFAYGEVNRIGRETVVAAMNIALRDRMRTSTTSSV
jgi:hypothetical protein